MGIYIFYTLKKLWDRSKTCKTWNNGTCHCFNGRCSTRTAWGREGWGGGGGGDMGKWNERNAFSGVNIHISIVIYNNKRCPFHIIQITLMCVRTDLDDILKNSGTQPSIQCGHKRCRHAQAGLAEALWCYQNIKSKSCTTAMTGVKVYVYIFTCVSIGLGRRPMV